jgi:hypothetical protein
VVCFAVDLRFGDVGLCTCNWCVSSLTVNDVFFPDAATDNTSVVLIYHEKSIPKFFAFVLSLAVLHVFFLDRLTDSMFVYSIYQGESNPQLFSLVLSPTHCL